MKLIGQCYFREKELQKYGGGCHQKIGVSFLNTHFGKLEI